MEPLLDQTLPSNNQQFPPRGRAVSKLSSRHNRRKRCGEKSRGGKKDSDRVPIPSFTPIPNEYVDACGDDGETMRQSEQPRAAAAFRTNTCSDATKPTPRKTSIASECANVDSNQDETDHRCLVHDDDESRKRDRNGIITVVTDNPTCATSSSPSRKCAKNPKEDFQKTGVQQIPSKNSAAKVLDFPATSSASEKVSHATKLQPSNEAKPSSSSYFSSVCRFAGTQQMKLGQGDDTCDARNTNPEDVPVDNTCLDVREVKEFSWNQATNSELEIPCPESPKEKESNREVSSLPNKLSSSYSRKEMGQSHAVHSNCDSKDIDKNNETITKRPECISGESRLADMIEIFDDDSDIGQNDKAKTKTEHPGPSGTSGEIVNAHIKIQKISISDQVNRKRKVSSSVSRSSSVSSSNEELADDDIRSKKIVDRKDTTRQRKFATTKLVAATKTDVKMRATKKRSTTSAEKKPCFACVTCKCNGKSGADATSQFSALSGSDARQEQSLVNRLQRIERDIAWKEGQRHDVARALKKHQLKMVKSWADLNTIDQKPRFLPDADVGDELRISSLDSEDTIRVKKRVFGKQKMHQPTLTQIIRGSNDDGDKDDKFPTSEAANNFNSIEDSNHVASAGDADDDFLSFWTETVPIDSKRCSTMSYYNHALANFNSSKSIGKWAKATAATLQLEEDEGFGALANLFDSIVCCPRDPIDDDKDNSVGDGLSFVAGQLSPRGDRAAKQIERSVINDPEKAAAIQRMCPNWKDNIEFAQAQTDPDDLLRALHNVCSAKTKLESMKDRILQAFIDRHQTLEMYKKCLEGSLNRLSGQHREVLGTGEDSTSDAGTSLDR